jgi:hypothetical protein
MKVDAIKSQHTLVRFDVARNDCEHRGLAGTVRSHDADRRALLQLEGDSFGDDNLSEAFGDTFQL